MPQAQLLVVEDESIVALDIKNKLINMGYAVPAVVCSGKQAIKKAEEIRPDLVLMDIKLKGEWDGIQAAEQIRKRFHLPVIFLTACADEATLRRVKITEPYGYLLEPFQERELNKTIEMALYHHQQQQKLKENEQWLAAILTSIGDAVIATDIAGRVNFMNSVAETLTGWKQAEVFGQEAHVVVDIVDEKTGSSGENPVMKALQEGAVTQLENDILLIAKNGQKIPIDSRVAPIKDDHGNIAGAVLIFHKITEPEQTDQEIRRRNRELTLLNRIISASTTESEPVSILEITCRELALAFEVPQAAAALLNEDKTEAVVVAEYLAEGRPSGLNRTIPVQGNPAAQYVLVHKAPLAIADAQNDPRLAAVNDLMRDRGTISLLLMPLIIGDEVVGTLGLDAVEPRLFSAEEVGLAWRVADQVAGVLARARLDKAHRLLTTAIEQTAESVVITDTNGVIFYVNPAFEQVTGYSRAEVIGQNARILNSGKQDPAFYKEMWTTITSGRVWSGLFINKKKDGTLFTENATITPVRDENGAIVNFVAVKRDITHELQLEAQYRQAQKMEAVGLLAGGIAHDFNNLLTAINGFAELTQMRLAQDDPVQKLVGNVLHSGQRAADLVGQLLTFSRKQIIEPVILDLNTVVIDMEKMLRRVIGEHIQMETLLASDLWPVEADPTKIEQIVVNLAVNARDAMPNGGWLTIETSNAFLSEEYAASHLGVTPGKHVLLSISDTGCGMSDEVKARIFEPFFTTKEKDRGTGLGLATVYGIVKQSGGHIWVYSEPGQGTTFKIYLPCAVEVAATSSEDNRSSGRPRGTETILLVEDEPAVRELVMLMLREQGYRVLEAANGQEALRLSQTYQGKIELLLTDVVMPGMSGQELMMQLDQTRSDLKVLFMSGYADSIIAHHGVLVSNIPFMEKPFTTQTLVCKVREILDG